jgi:hypothetical protein
MNAVVYLLGISFIGLAVFGFVWSRRRIRSGPRNNWGNEAYLARDEAGSWTENECAVGHENAAPPPRIAGWGS